MEFLEKSVRDSGLIDISVDWNIITSPGVYIVGIGNTIDSSISLNAPIGAYGWGMLIVYRCNYGDSSIIMQLYFPDADWNGVAFYGRRKYYPQEWRKWSCVKFYTGE